MDTKTNRMGEILTLKLFSLTSSPPPQTHKIGTIDNKMKALSGIQMN